MKFTQPLHAQHIGRMVKRFWLSASQRLIRNTEVETCADRLKGATIVDANKIFKAQSKPAPKEVIKPIPTRKYPPIYSYNTDSLLIEGLEQAQVLTKSVAVGNLPQRYTEFLDKLKIADDVHATVEMDILSAHLFDAEQKKTKRLHDPLRPAFNFPRVYGITEERKNILILDKLIRQCERLTWNKAEILQKKILHNPLIRVVFDKDGDKIGMDLAANLLISSKKPIDPLGKTSEDINEVIPDLFPLKFTSSLKSIPNDGWETFYPLNSGNNFVTPHTVFPTFTSFTKTLHELPINKSQIRSRTLIYAFAAASSRAKQQFGADVRKLPHPIVVQSIHTNGQSYHFGVFQLNTLDLSGSDGEKNVWYETEIEDLYESCSYREAIPHLERYNPNILAKFFTFYSQ
uniref:Large ribosomal subunit protein mL37 n=1 Tax=Lutzomyia longipalpis TaxID=7200 RepID=A0A7G3AQR1_LUTLO